MKAAMSVVLVLAGVGFVLGAEKDRQYQAKMPNEVRRHFQRLVGRWEIKTTIADSTSEGEWTCKWAPERTCLIISFSGTFDGEPFHGMGVQGWDPVEKRIQETHFTRDGMGTLRLECKSPDVLEGPWTGVLKGKPARSTDTFEWLGPDEWKITSKGEVEGVLHAKRIPKEIQKEPTADDYMKFFKYVAGQWKTKGTIGGESFEGTWSSELSPTGRCLVAYSTMDGKPFDHVLHGYDPEAKCWTGLGFQADGAVVQIQARFVPESLREGLLGAKLRGKVKVIIPEGKVKSVETVTTILSEDKFKHEVSGERPVESVFERQMKEQ
ncbi:MAG: hypothetical protein ACOX1P_31960 [Thermoguttaceae bacterium]|jgi:hypothetical protein